MHNQKPSGLSTVSTDYNPFTAWSKSLVIFNSPSRAEVELRWWIASQEISFVLNSADIQRNVTRDFGLASIC